MIAVLVDRTQETSISDQEIENIAEAARIFGCPIYPIHSDTDISPEEIFAYVPQYKPKILGIWVGFIPSIERYKSIYDAALNKGIQLVNSPEQYRLAMEFDKFYPHVKDITPKSIIIQHLDELTDDVTFPVFVKGAVKSNKSKGWDSVVANNISELKILAKQIFSHQNFSRGKLIIRELVHFKQIATDPNGFPINREYRAFLYKGELLAYGFYWDEYRDSNPLTKQDKQDILALLKSVSSRIGTPFLAVDIGQLENGDWIVIEIGDGQFSGLSQIPVLELWSKIKDFTL